MTVNQVDNTLLTDAGYSVLREASDNDQAELVRVAQIGIRQALAKVRTGERTLDEVEPVIIAMVDQLSEPTSQTE